MLSTPWHHNVQFCKNKQPAIVESSKFEKKKNKVLPMKNLKRLIQTIHKKKLEVNQNHGSHNNKNKEKPKPLICNYNLH